jgi:integrase
LTKVVRSETRCFPSQPPTPDPKVHDWLRRSEDEALLSAFFKTEDERIIVWFLRWTGLRLGEALSLLISDLDLNEGIKRLTPHRLRRTFGSHLLNEGVRLEVVSKLLGHRSTEVTEDAYAELLDQTVRQEMLTALSG